MNRSNVSVNATFCTALVDQWVREGLQAAFIAPGSRSTPLALAFVARDDITVELFHDERSASFAALGHALATGSAAAVICTSGTAGAHFFAAVIEADQSAVPLLVCTADRPPELWGRGAPQTIDQTELYGNSVRSFVQPGPPDDLYPSDWRAIAQQSWQAAMGTAAGDMPGPVQLNLSFRDPLTGEPDTLPDALDSTTPELRSGPASDELAEIVGTASGQPGVIIVGRSESPPAQVLRLAERLGWPLIADHRSGCRIDHPNVVHRFDSLLRYPEFSEAHQPGVVVRLGEIVASKAVSQWLSRTSATVIAARPQGRHIDPEDIASLSVDEFGLVEALLADLDGDSACDRGWLDSWRGADDAAERSVAATLADTATVNEVAIARTVLDAVPAGGALVVASSMPIRDLEWFGGPRGDVTVISNRGANGIDGTIATATGVALTGRPTVCVTGDVAFLHDSTSLTALRHRCADLTIVVIDNDGGGIFSFLAQHELLSHERYEQLFGTPHGTDLAALVRAHGLDVEAWPGKIAPDGIRVIVATTDRVENLALHDRLHARVAEALG